MSKTGFYTLISINEVKRLTGLSRSGIYDLISRGLFPRQIKTNERRSAWIQEEIMGWVSHKMEERKINLQPSNVIIINGVRYVRENCLSFKEESL